MRQLELFKKRLPNKPYCSNNLENGLKIYNKNIACKNKYIQFNQPNIKQYLVFDCDHQKGLDLLEGENLPTPNIFISNPKNGHSHIFYSLETPVSTGEFSHLKPISYLAKIKHELTEKLQADRNYQGFISKNPLSDFWRVEEFRQENYSLNELADYFDLPKKLPQKALTVAEGRNCHIFDTVRYIAYSSVLKFRMTSNLEQFSKYINQECHNLNNNFPQKLTDNEIKCISKSISKWVWSKYTGRTTDEQFSNKQRAKQKLTTIALNKKSEAKRNEAQELSNNGYSQREIANLLEVSQKSISNWLK